MSQTTVLLHLVEGPVNLGAVCRAMANTDFSELKFTGELDKQEPDARRFALHAAPILDAAEKVEDLVQLLAGFDLVFGFTPRNPWPDGRGLSLDGFLEQYAQAKSEGRSVGLLFGNEARGLQNEHLVHCQYRVSLPTHSGYTSMNLAQAVLVVLWELARARDGERPNLTAEAPDRVSREEKEQLLANLRRLLEELEFLDPQNPEHLWSEIAPIFLTRDWSERELTILHSIFGKARSRYKAAQKKQMPPRETRET